MYSIKPLGPGVEYFLVENRQTGTGWNRGYPDDASGLLIWHVNDNREFQIDAVDLIEADNISEEDPPLSDRSTYSGDPFPGTSVKTRLTDFTIPSSTKRWETKANPDPNVHIGNSNVLIVDIQGSGNSMTADLSPFWAGEIPTSTTWSGAVRVGGDVTVNPDVTLTLGEGTGVRFLADRDDTETGGVDADKSELIIEGSLAAGAGSTTLRSSNDNPAGPEWYGVRLNGGAANLSNATLRDGVACVPVTSGEGFELTGARLEDCGLITGSGDVSFPEDRIDPVETYEAAGRLGSSVTWDLEGDDEESFTITPAGSETTDDAEELGADLAFSPLPNFEEPTDKAKPEMDNEYGVVVVVSGGQLQATKKVAVNVTDVYEPEVPRPPGGLSAESGWTLIHLEWLPAADVSRYDVQMQGRYSNRSVSDDPTVWPTDWTLVAENEATATEGIRHRYTHTGLDPDYIYRYRVRSRIGDIVRHCPDLS